MYLHWGIDIAYTLIFIAGALRKKYCKHIHASINETAVTKIQGCENMRFLVSQTGK
jgi:hypothetical protein